MCSKFPLRHSSATYFFHVLTVYLFSISVSGFYMERTVFFVEQLFLPCHYVPLKWVLDVSRNTIDRPVY